MIKKMKKGFTLVELVIVIAVIAILTAILVPTFISLSNRASKASDKSLVKNLNTALAIQEQEPGDTKNNTLQDAVDDLEIYGYLLPNLVTKSGDKLLWNQETNRFILEGDDKQGYADIKFWRIQNSIEENQKYSVYAGQNFVEPEGGVEVSVGFDAGYHALEKVKYVNSGAAQTVSIRTNSASTTLTIDDASTGTIYHYGASGALNIIQCHTGSYHENGKVAYSEIAKGRVVLEKGSDVEEIHINKKTDSSFDTVIIANNGGAEELPERITRDAVTVSEETLVVKVESNGSSENVYVYADEATGTKGSTQKVVDSEDPSHNQNANVNSALGQLVLDNGSTGDKAQTAAEKEAAKQEIVQEAIIEEIEENDKYVARIGTTPFESLKDAVAAAATSSVIEMIANDASTESISVNKTLTINMNSFTFGGTIVVATASNSYVKVNGTANVDAVSRLNNYYFPNLYVQKSGTVYLLKDHTLPQIYFATYGNNGDYTINLNGHTLTLTENSSEGGVYVGNFYGSADKLTFRDGNIAFTGTGSSSRGFEAYGNLVVNNVNITSSCGYTFYGEAGYWDGPSSITITDSTINATKMAINTTSYKSGSTIKQSTVAITGSTIISGDEAVKVNGSNVTIMDSSIQSASKSAIATYVSETGVVPSVVINGTGTIQSQAQSSAYNTIDVHGGTLNINGNVNVISENTALYADNGSITITAGEYTGRISLGSSGQLTIAGGTFDGNIIQVTQNGRLLVIGETQYDELTNYIITGSNGNYVVEKVS